MPTQPLDYPKDDLVTEIDDYIRNNILSVTTINLLLKIIKHLESEK